MNHHDATPAPEGAGVPSRGDAQAGGAGQEGTIPVSNDGISLTTTADGSTFNPEEDPYPAPGSDAAERDQPGADEQAGEDRSAAAAPGS